MRRITLVISLVATAGLLVSQLPAAADIPAAHTLKLDARFTYSKTAGRLELAKDTLSVGKRVVGHDIVSCLQVTASSYECSFTETITRIGSLQAEGLQGSTNAPVAMAIVGGTGAYTGAAGTMTTSNALTSVEHYLLRYTLPTAASTPPRP
jgi:hypothetical protein